VLKVELHTHTSDDPHDRIPHTTADLIDRAADLGYDAVAVTLHDRQLDLSPWQQQAADRGIVLIPGIERTIEGKHVLLLNFSERSEDVGSFDDLAALKRDEPGLVIAPHPFFPNRTCLGRALMDRHADLFDAVEYNAMFTYGMNFNLAAARWARAHGKPMVGDGDVHRLRQLGTTFSLVDAAPDPASICEAIRQDRATVVAHPLSWMATATLATQLLLIESLRDRWTFHPRDTPFPTVTPDLLGVGARVRLGVGSYPRKNV
jgi:predicted metal-dependent phosphoesterase TrpH